MADWDREDIAAAIRKTGVTLQQLGMRHGFSQAAVARALRQPWPSVERIIADHLHLQPSVLWPSRYRPDGQPVAGGWTFLSRRSGKKHRQERAAQ